MARKCTKVEDLTEAIRERKARGETNRVTGESDSFERISLKNGLTPVESRGKAV